MLLFVSKFKNIQMKKILVLILMFTLTVTQAQKSEKQVALVAEYTKVADLSKAESAKLLELIIERGNARAALKKAHKKDKKTYKAKAKDVEKVYVKNLRKLVGNAKADKIIAYKETKKAEKKASEN